MTQEIQVRPEKQSKFSLDDALAAGWRGTWKYFWAYLGIVTTMFLFSSIPTLVGLSFTWGNQSMAMMMLGMVLSICGAVLQDVIALGMINVNLMALDGKPIVSRDVFSVFPLFLKYIGAGILYKLMMFFGYICFIVPGIILQIKFQFYGYFIVERKMGPIQALKASSVITKDAKMDLFLFGIVQWFINSLGAMIFLVGSFPAYVINSLASASVYRQLVSHTPVLELALPPPPPVAELPGTTSSGEIERA